MSGCHRLTSEQLVRAIAVTTGITVVTGITESAIQGIEGGWPN